MAEVRRKRPRDTVQLAKLIGDIATGQAADTEDDGKNAAAVALGRLGGIRSAEVRAKSISPTKRKAIAKRAAKARWQGK